MSEAENMSKRKIQTKSDLAHASAPPPKRKRGRPRKADAKTPKQRYDDFREKNPEYEYRAKEKQRQSERLVRFHLVRAHVSKHPIPEHIDQTTDLFKRVELEYREECEEQTVREVADKQQNNEGAE